MDDSSSFLERIPLPRGVGREECAVSVDGQHYYILRRLGSGGFSTVFSVLGTDGRTYALKHLEAARSGRGGDAQMESFREEIAKIKQLQGNESIIRYIGSEIVGSVARIVLEEGEFDLKHWISEQRAAAAGGYIEQALVRVVWKQILAGVKTLHTFDPRIVHGDLKPANFLFVRGRVKLIDFGTCMKVPDDTINVAHGGSLLGTLNYMAPEAIEACNGEAKYGIPRDIWSLGCILYAIVYGHPPFASFSPALNKMRKILDPAFEIPYPELPALRFTRSRIGGVADIIDVMQRCLRRDPYQRPHVVGADGRDGLLDHEFLLPKEALSAASSAPASAATAFAARPKPGASGVEMTPRVKERRAALVSRSASRSSESDRRSRSSSERSSRSGGRSSAKRSSGGNSSRSRGSGSGSGHSSSSRSSRNGSGSRRRSSGSRRSSEAQHDPENAMAPKAAVPVQRGQRAPLAAVPVDVRMAAQRRLNARPVFEAADAKGTKKLMPVMSEEEEEESDDDVAMDTDSDSDGFDATPTPTPTSASAAPAAAPPAVIALRAAALPPPRPAAPVRAKVPHAVELLAAGALPSSSVRRKRKPRRSRLGTARRERGLGTARREKSEGEKKEEAMRAAEDEDDSTSLSLDSGPVPSMLDVGRAFVPTRKPQVCSYAI